jgi:ATP-binding cassette subfamily B protein
MVLQTNLLFSGTIEENLRWGNENATMEQIRNAAKIAQADEFVMSFPDGYNTDLGQGGVNVSGGQKQRLCIARAILKEPKVLILDDSTSAVDTATDGKIREGMKNLLPDTTKIIIAQRINSIQHADKIVVLDDGKINDIGTHDELLQRNEIYKEVYVSQQESKMEQ